MTHNPVWGLLLDFYVDNLYVSKGEEYLRFDRLVKVWQYNPQELVTETHGLIFETESDCCSETWFADIVGVQNLLKATITGVEILQLPDPEDARGRQEWDEAYGVKLKTTKGTCDIIYRNSSNGYYSGSARPCKAMPEGVEWVEITDDWQA